MEAPPAALSLRTSWLVRLVVLLGAGLGLALISQPADASPPADLGTAPSKIITNAAQPTKAAEHQLSIARRAASRPPVARPGMPSAQQKRTAGLRLPALPHTTVTAAQPPAALLGRAVSTAKTEVSSVVPARVPTPDVAAPLPTAGLSQSARDANTPAATSSPRSIKIIKRYAVAAVLSRETVALVTAVPQLVRLSHSVEATTAGLLRAVLDRGPAGDRPGFGAGQTLGSASSGTVGGGLAVLALIFAACFRAAPTGTVRTRATRSYARHPGFSPD